MSISCTWFVVSVFVVVNRAFVCGAIEVSCSSISLVMSSALSWNKLDFDLVVEDKVILSVINVVGPVDFCVATILATVGNVVNGFVVTIAVVTGLSVAKNSARKLSSS